MTRSPPRKDVVVTTASCSTALCTFLTQKDLRGHIQCSRFMRLREGACVSKDTLRRNQDSLLTDFPFNLPEGLNRQVIIIQQIYTELELSRGGCVCVRVHVCVCVCLQGKGEAWGWQLGERGGSIRTSCASGARGWLSGQWRSGLFNHYRKGMKPGAPQSPVWL